eukprot:TRINITY_DN29129_c0_g1_i2.p1 TRINITY_DN29129_c0_g1~~TRINITY_DN29129_c0_g1_i2.p1  ORF type:complete len:505 (+),score=66.98 TRINITY_DN29129_c0_g1_i2:25-1515(+)
MMVRIIALVLLARSFDTCWAELGTGRVHRLDLVQHRCDESAAHNSCHAFREAHRGSHAKSWAPLSEEAVSRLNTTLGLQLDAAPTSETKATMFNNFDLIYTVVVNIGAPAVSARLIVDTGSSDLWFRTSTVKPFFGFGGLHPSYDRSKSTTAAKSSGEIVTVTYGQGMVDGIEMRDRICLGKLCVANQSFLTASAVFGIPDQWLFDGVLGLAFPVLAHNTHGATFIQNLDAMFDHFAIGCNVQGHGSNGYLAFGEFSDLESEAQREFGQGVTAQLYRVNGELLYWLVQAEVLVERTRNSQSKASMPGPEIAMAILDSGTSLIAVPVLAYVWLIRTLVDETPSILQKCTLTLPNAYGQLICMCDVEISPIVFSVVGSDGRKLRVQLETKDLKQVIGAGFCRIGIMPTMLPLWILGDTFLRHVYVVHDVHGRQVQLYPQPGSQAATVLEAAEQTSSVTLIVAFIVLLVAFCALALAVASARRRNARQDIDLESRFRAM